MQTEKRAEKRRHQVFMTKLDDGERDAILAPNDDS
jgi:hypothetical protein